jgi:hypothetical protein
MANEDEDFVLIGGMIRSYLNQDMDLEAGSVPEAVAQFSGHIDDSQKAELFRSMDDFMQRYEDEAEAEFKRRWGFDFVPKSIGQTVSEFFAMVRAIVEDPTSYHRFE